MGKERFGHIPGINDDRERRILGKVDKEKRKTEEKPKPVPQNGERILKWENPDANPAEKNTRVSSDDVPKNRNGMVDSQRSQTIAKKLEEESSQEDEWNDLPQEKDSVGQIGMRRSTKENVGHTYEDIDTKLGMREMGYRSEERFYRTKKKKDRS